MAIQLDSKIILFKLESTYGTDPSPVGADAVLMMNAQISPMEGEDVSREIEFPYLAAQPTIPTGLRGRLTGRCELSGSGTAGTAPAWGKLLRACAVAETISAGTSVTYNPVSSSHESGTIHFWLGGTRHVLTGVRGTATLRVAAQAIPHIEFELTGLWNAPGEETRVTPDLSAFKKPLIGSDTNTPTFSINSVDMVLREAVLSLNNQVNPDLLIGSEEIRIPTRADSFSARVRAVPLTTFNPYALARAQTEVAVSLVHGTTAGNIATLSLPQCQLKRLPGIEDGQRLAEWPLELTPLAASGNDQWTLVVT